MRAQTIVIATSLALAAVILSGDLSNVGQLRAQQTVKKVDMGDYEPVVPWPKPLPDTDLSHDGGHGALPGQFDGVHHIHVDSARTLYVTEVSNDRSQMFRPKPNADPNRIIG